ncbi:MAG: hypothetical protein BGO90_10280 [Legionella sp. 40-6]|nr:GtrA family protein [Legionella sp.]OJY42794.1 MAG: hypothetical protein BGO90_10280 [Legionella sp. 40-6]
MKRVGAALQRQMFGFAITGGLSTLIMFGIYIALYRFINYQYAYFISYLVSVFALYIMNSYVFKGNLSVKTFFHFLLIYLLQYFFGAVSLEFLVRIGVSVTFAPLVVVILLLPITFVLNRIVFNKHYQ